MSVRYALRFSVQQFTSTRYIRHWLQFTSIARIPKFYARVLKENKGKIRYGASAGNTIPWQTKEAAIFDPRPHFQIYVSEANNGEKRSSWMIELIKAKPTADGNRNYGPRRDGPTQRTDRRLD